MRQVTRIKVRRGKARGQAARRGTVGHVIHSDSRGWVGKSKSNASNGQILDTLHAWREIQTGHAAEVVLQAGLVALNKRLRTEHRYRHRNFLQSLFAFFGGDYYFGDLAAVGRS